MGLKGLTPYEKLKKPKEIEVLKDFKVSETPTLNTTFSFSKIKDKKFCSHPI